MLSLDRIAGAPADITFCPILLNDGLPLIGPFTVAGRVIGPPSEIAKLVLVNKADDDTCFPDGKPPAHGYFYARGSEVRSDGRFSFTDPLGADSSSVTIARNFEFLYTSPTSKELIIDDRAKQGDKTDYGGLKVLPNDAWPVAKFRQPPGTYKGKGSPCKNE